MSERWKQVRRICEEALELAEPDRPAFVLERCGNDSELRREVERVLAADARADEVMSFLDGGAKPLLARGLSNEVHPGSRVGSFQIEGILANGGMGTVYRATQEHPRRSVALKVMRLSSGSPESLRRFEFEAEILARLNHPGIAHVYESGTHAETTAEGDTSVPYFAMELVEGARTITRHVREESLDVEAAVRLFLSVGDAVQHGHQRGVIHRDLKPGNILVDGSGTAKLIDFGIARLTEPQAHALQTGTGCVLGTLAYMSPEQVRGEEIDTRTDVYSLGAVLYEALCGTPPHTAKQGALPDLARAICEDTPRKPSLVRRGTPIELDWILARALEKDRDRRYSSMNEFAADLRAFLEHEPLVAGPPSATYRLRRFVRRHRLAVGAATLVALSLVGALVASALAWSEAIRERDLAIEARAEEGRQRERADRERNDAVAARSAEISQRERAETISDFLRNMLTSVAPHKDGRDVQVLEVLDRASRQIFDEPPQDPRARASLHHVIASALLHLERHRDALPHAEEAYALFREEDTWRDPMVFHAAISLGTIVRHDGQIERCIELMREGYAGLVALQGLEDRGAMRAGDLLGLLLSETGQNPVECEALLVRSFHDRMRALGDEDRATLVSMHNLASFLHRMRRIDEAESLYREVLRVRTLHLAPDHPDRLITLNGLAGLLFEEGQPDLAEPLFEEVCEGRRVRLGENHPSTLLALNNLAAVIERNGDAGRAEAIVRDLTKRHAAVAGRHNERYVYFAGQWARLLVATHEFEEADRTFRESLALADEFLPRHHWRRGILLHYHSACLRLLGKYDESQQALDGALECFEVSFGADHPRVARVRQEMAELARLRRE